MADPFDPYREALVVESDTIWPDEIARLVADPAERKCIAQQLHADAAKAGDLQYVRLHAGFARHITVTAADVERLRSR